jgi:WD40 repeat protein
LNLSKIFALTLLLAMSGNQLLAQSTAGSSVEVAAVLRGHTKSIQQIEFSHSGEIVATSSEDGTVRLWRTATGESLTAIAIDHGSDVYRIRWSSDDRLLAIAHRNKKHWELAVWEVPHGQRPIISHKVEYLYFLEWSPRGHTFLSVDEDAKLQIWDVFSKQPTRTIDGALASNKPYRVSFVADGERILTASGDQPAQVWETATGKLLDSYPPNTSIPGFTYPSAGVPVLSLDNRFLISGNANIHETATGRLLTSMTGNGGPVSFSPDGENVLTLSTDAADKSRHRQSYLTVQKIDSGEELSSFQVPEGVDDIIWSPDGKTMAIVGLTFHTRIIDAATGRENGRLPYPNCWPWTMCGSDGCEPIRFSANGETLFKEIEPIKLWDASTVSLVRVLKDARLPAVFSPTDGRLLATRGKNKKSAVLWRLSR